MFEKIVFYHKTLMYKLLLHITITDDPENYSDDSDESDEE